MEEGDDEDCPDVESSDHEFQRATNMMCLEGGASLNSSHHQLKKWAREVIAAEPSIGVHKPLKRSHTLIIFDSEDHPDRVNTVGCFPSLVSPTICNLRVTKILVDGGAGLNLISPDVIRKLQIPEEDLEDTSAFQGINLGNIQPKGKITLPETFGSDQNYWTEKVVVDVTDNPFAYNGILGRPALATFMVASHYAYGTLKMPGPVGVIIIRADKKHTLWCTDRLYQEAVAEPAVKAPSATTKIPGEKKAGKRSSHVDPGKYT
ncbi:hypothetical protein D1007_62481 [Hordeum vulgare]|nr:hypothetical protein D1007_62481 [Hordeum vulgare]